MSDYWKTRQCPKCDGFIDHSGQHDCSPFGESLLDSLVGVSTMLDKGYWRDDAQYQLARFYAVHTKDALIEAQAKRLKAIARDAARYRWLRSHPVFQCKELPNELELLDASIDRYMARRETEE